MLKKLKNDVLNDVSQFDNVDEFYNHLMKTYINSNENKIDVDVIEMYCEIYNEIKNVHKNILHILLYDECFCVYENKNDKNDKNVAHLYEIDENEFFYINRACCDNYDEFLKINNLQYVE